jgi:hypothetical protein
MSTVSTYITNSVRRRSGTVCASVFVDMGCHPIDREKRGMDNKERKGGGFDGPICRACQKRLSDKEGTVCFSCAAKMRNADAFASSRRFIRYDMIHGGVLIPTSIDNRRN